MKTNLCKPRSYAPPPRNMAFSAAELTARLLLLQDEIQVSEDEDVASEQGIRPLMARGPSALQMACTIGALLLLAVAAAMGWYYWT